MITVSQTVVVNMVKSNGTRLKLELGFGTTLEGAICELIKYSGLKKDEYAINRIKEALET